jgi:ABC-type branched-subunit amino acid transport system permease subunit
LATLEFWRLIFGIIIIAICVVMPKGIAGSTRSLFVQSRPK